MMPNESDPITTDGEDHAEPALSSDRASPPFLSVVSPVYNEAENLDELHTQLTSVLAAQPYSYEIVYVDDGSTDGSTAKLHGFATRDQHVVACELSRNSGQTAAISAGIDLARGDVVVLVDADLQNDPSDIPMLLSRMDEGYDVVSGWRKDRRDKWLTRRLPSQIANALISRISGVRLHDFGCTLKAYRRSVLTGFRLYGEMHRFMPAYAAQMGARILEVPVTHHARMRGTSKYGLERTFKVILDLVVVKFLDCYSNRPIHFFGGFGVLCGLSSFGILAYLICDKMLSGRSMIQSPLLLMTVMLLLLGSQSVFIGLLAEQLNRTYHESQGKPAYRIRRISGVAAGDRARNTTDSIPSQASAVPHAHGQSGSTTG